MLNMIKLDWLGMKCYHKRFVIIPLFILPYGLLHEVVIIPFMAYMMLSFSVNPFAVEEKGKLDNLYLTLPVTRKNIVTARFGLSLIMQFAGLVLGTVIALIYNALLYGRTVLYVFTHTFKADFDAIFLIICSSLLFYAIMNLSTFPILFKVGYAKGKLFGFIIPIVAASVIAGIFVTLFNANIDFGGWVYSVIEWVFANTVWTAAIILGAAVLILTGSYALSQRLYAGREF